MQDGTYNLQQTAVIAIQQFTSVLLLACICQSFSRLIQIDGTSVRRLQRLKVYVEPTQRYVLHSSHSLPVVLVLYCTPPKYKTEQTVEDYEMTSGTVNDRYAVPLLSLAF